MNSENLSRDGRKPTFTRREAFELLENKKLLRNDGRITAALFIKMMTEVGELKKSCSTQTMQRLLNGSMYPDLKRFDREGNETDVPYDYKEVPREVAGQPPKEERLNPDGTLKVEFSGVSRKLLQEVERKTEAKAATIATLTAEQFLSRANERILDLEHQVRALGRWAQVQGFGRITPQ